MMQYLDEEIGCILKNEKCLNCWTKYGHRSFLSFFIFKAFIFYIILNIFLEYG